MLESAELAAGEITPARIAADAQLDVYNGSAGAILALLALHAANGSTLAVQRARLAADNLLQRRTYDPASGAMVWLTGGPRASTGFAHGSAGIAHALLQLHAVTGERALVDAVREARRFERAAFLEIFGDIDSRAELDAALDTTAAHPVIGSDFLCCGTMGRVDLLVTASDALARPELRVLALAQTDEMLHRAGSPVLVRTAGTGDGTFSPGLLQGTAGIGYELLRLESSALLPSVLTWS